MNSDETNKRSGRDRRQTVAGPFEIAVERRVADRRGLRVEDAQFWDWASHFIRAEINRLGSKVAEHNVESRRSGTDRRSRNAGPPSGVGERRVNIERRILNLQGSGTRSQA